VTSATGLPEGAAPRGRAIRVQFTTVASGAAVGALPKLVGLTLPVDATTDTVTARLTQTLQAWLQRSQSDLARTAGSAPSRQTLPDRCFSNFSFAC